MSRYCDGDQAAFYELYALVAPRLLAYLRGFFGDRASADDVLQLTFLKLHRSRQAYVRGADPMPWLFAIAYRTCLDELRRRRREREGVARFTDEPSAALADLDGQPEGTRDDSQVGVLVAAALRALDALPPSQRQAVTMTKLEGKTLSEAAVVAGTTPGAIKLRVHRGYEALRRLLSKERT